MTVEWERLVSLVRVFSLNHSDSVLSQATKAAGKGAKGAGKAAAKPRGGRIVETWCWETQRVKLLSTVSNAIQASTGWQAQDSLKRHPNDSALSLLVASSSISKNSPEHSD